MGLSAKDLLTRAALKTTTVEIEGGGTVTVREFSVADRGEFMHRSRTNPGSLSAWIVCQCALDDSGVRLYGDGDEAALAKSSPQVLDPIGTAVLKLSGMAKDKETPEAGEA